MRYVGVAIGGFAGACLRYLISELCGTLSGFPLATLLINISGSIFLAWLYTITLDRWPIHPHLRLALGTGFVGAFTTFSTFTVETWKLMQLGRWDWALLYATLSFAGCLAGAGAGYLLAARQTRLRMPAGFTEEA